jgi:hypothetical protein
MSIVVQGLEISGTLKAWLSPNDRLLMSPTGETKYSAAISDLMATSTQNKINLFIISILKCDNPIRFSLFCHKFQKAILRNGAFYLFPSKVYLHGSFGS